MDTLSKRAFCETCCFWSDMLAKHEHGTMFAICLNVSATKYGSYTGEGDGCPRHIAGEPIDQSQRVAT